MPFTPEEKAAWRAGQAEAKAIAKKRHGHEPVPTPETPGFSTSDQDYYVELHHRRASTGELVVMVTRRKRLS